MGRVAVRHARGGAVALLGFAGVVIAHLALGLSPLNQRSAARAADAPVEQAQQARSVLGDAQPAQARNFRVADNFDIVDLQQQFENVARRVAPAVVAISGADSAMQGDGALRTEEINADKLSSFLDTVDRTVGTGFVVDSDGYIVTNDHVVGKAEQLWVTTDDHKVYPAIVVGSDPRADIAVLKIPATNLPTVKLSEGGPARRGQWTIALGNPYGLSVSGDMCMSVGIVSATGRSLPKLSGKEDRLYSDLIQTTAQINPGNSGGPLFDLRGEVIGINTAVILPQKQTNGIGFAIPMGGRIMQIINDLKEGREIVYGYLGVKSSTPTARERKAAGIDDEIGAYIDSVDKDSPAGAADLRKGDIVVRFNGELIRDGDQFIRTVGAAPVGRPVSVSFYRKDKVRTADVVLRRRELASAAVTRESRRLRWRGMLLGPIPAQWDFGAAKRPEAGLMVIGIEPGSPHAKEGVVHGSVITAVAGRAVRDVTDLQRVINDVPPEDWALDVTGRQEVVASTTAGN
jgi:serine protease Do